MEQTNNNNNNNNESFFQKIKDRTSEYLITIPLTTRFFFLTCILLFISEYVIPISLYKVCFSPQLLSNDPIYNIYRMITSNYFHLNIIHILFNMLSFISLGTILERNKFGSLYLFYLIMLFSILIPMVSFIISWISYILSLSYSWLGCSVGFSSIIFSLLEIHFYQLSNNNGNGNDLVSLYGITKIPCKLYPWVILIITNLILPGSSFINHLSGILIGLLYCLGYLNNFIISSNKFNEIESSNQFNYILSINGFITNLNYSLPITNNNNSNNSSNTSSSSSSSLNNSFSRLSQYFSNRNSGRMLGTISSNQLEEQDQQDDNIDININNNNNSNNKSPTLKYSPIIDMSK